MTAGRHDFTIEKKAKFYKEFQITYADGTPRPLTDKTVKMVIKESTMTSTILHNLTEDNGSITLLDDDLGKFGVLIPAQNTDVDADFGVYDVILIDVNFPQDETERVLQGKVIYSKGISDGQ